MTSAGLGCLLAFGVLFVGCGLALCRRRARRTSTWLFLGTGATFLLAAALDRAAPGAADRLQLFGALVLGAALLMVYPDGRVARPWGAVALAVVTTTGCLAVAAPTTSTRDAYGLAEFFLVVAYLWWRFEHAGEPERRALLWLVLTGSAGGLLAGHALFLVPSAELATVLGSLALAPVPVGLTIGILSPHVMDVRAAMTRTVAEGTALVAAVALFIGGLNLLALATGRPAGTGAAAVLAAGCAVGFHPLRLVLLGTMDRLLFGERDDPVQAVSHVGRTLDDPVSALRALREALALPYAALHDDHGQVAASGTPSTSLHAVDLEAGGRAVGRLEVGLRPGELRLSRRDRVVLDVVQPALSQALQALALTRQLHESRADVITAVEEERRRLRHDLHDTVGPTLTGIAYKADAAGNTVARDPARAAELIAGLRADTARALSDVRRVVEGLRPPAVDELGLVGALRQQVLGLYGDGGAVRVQLDAREPLAHLPAAVEVAAYRIVTEALTNVARHADSSEAIVLLRCEGARLAVEVRDGGCSPAPWEPGVGLTSMRERAEQLGGSFITERGPAGGRVRAELPLA